MISTKIYQCYYKQEQLEKLNSAFIPFDNTANEVPDDREYPLLFKLYQENKEFDGLWGMFSFRWNEKVKNYTAQDFINWINDNPGYDVYLPDTIPRRECQRSRQNNNVFTQGDSCHPGMIDYFNRLSSILEINIDISKETIPPDYIIFSHYYVGNKKFWDNWIPFIQKCIDITKNDTKLYNYCYVQTSRYRSNSIRNLCFVIERLAAYFLYINKNEYKIITYPGNPGESYHIPNALKAK